MPFADPLPHTLQHSLIEAAVVFWVVFSLGMLAYRFTMSGVAKLTARDASGIEGRVVEALRTPLRMWVPLVAVLAALRDLNTQAMPALVELLFVYLAVGLIVVSFTMAATRITVILLGQYFARTGQPMTTLTVTLIRMTWMTPGLLLVMNMFGISLAPILTALGVGGIAVALGLRDTLANLFAGFYVILAGQFDQGDFVRLSSGEEGYVSDIRWRMTSLKTLSNHLVLIPNSKLAEAIVTNFSKPDRTMALSVPVRLPANADFDKAGVCLLEIASEVGTINRDLLANPAPSVSMTSILPDSNVELSLVVTVPEYRAQYAVLDQIRRRIVTRLPLAGLTLAAPVTHVVHRDETGLRTSSDQGKTTL
jgi:small-conductance mechanosensitive channel